MKLDSHLDEISADAALYALGSLPPEEASRFEQRLKSGCSLCLAEYSAFADVTDVLAMDVTTLEPPASLRDRMLQRATGKPRPGSDQMQIVRGDESRWIPAPVPGIEMRPLLGQKTMLVRMQAGSTLPSHKHDRAEQCLVLEGSLSYDAGSIAKAGDFVYMPAGSIQRTIHSELGCTFLITYTA